MLDTRIPDPGQMVQVRQRQFVVQEVHRGAALTDVLREASPGRQHLITLSSLEDDALGEELRVVWELEPAASLHEQMGLPAPTGWDAPRRLDAFLDAVRWGAIASADTRTLQAPFRSGIAIEDYQLDPVARAVAMPRANLLIADDVGLGKTIEAGLVAQEMLLRHRVRTILIICPAGIQLQWQEQMRDKFGLEFRIVDSALFKTLRRQRGLHVNPWNHFPRLITSIDFLKRERPLRLLRELLPAEGEPAYPRRWDLLILDEAHNVAPSGAGQYATDSQRTLAIRTLAPHAEHKLFLSATPHNGYPESFSALLELLDNQRFARGIRPEPEQLGAVMVRRLKREITDSNGRPVFPERELEAIEVPYTEAERKAHHLLQAYAMQRRTGIRDEAERFATEFVLKLLKKRLFSSPHAFALTLERHEEAVSGRRRHATTPSLGVLRRQVEEIEEEAEDDERYLQAAGEVIDTAGRLFHPLTPVEQTLLRELRTWAADAAGQPDSKAAELITWLKQTLRPAGEWNNERVILFTEYRDTQRWLHELLAAQGLAGGDRLLTLYGGMDTENRERVKAAFQAHPAISPVRILLATDTASEGIDLQNHCSRLIHYEIPWNPNRMEQRNGRVDRHGQRAPHVQIFHFVGKGYRRDAASGRSPGSLEGDLEFLMRAALKVDTIREDLGKVGPVIADRVERAMLGESATLDTRAEERAAGPDRALLGVERRLREQLEKLHVQLEETQRELHLTPENIEHVVRVGLEVAGQPPLQPVPLPAVPGEAPVAGHAYRLPALRGSWARCTEGLAHPHTGVIRPVVFDHALARDRDDVVLIHLNHRLVQMCLRLLRAEVWAQGNSKRLHRFTARLLPPGFTDAPLVIAHGRIVVLGADNQRLHEEVIAAGGILRHGRFARLNVGEVRAGLAAARPESVPPAVAERLATAHPGHAASLLAALEARMGDRTAGLQRTLHERSAAEQEAIRAILSELRAAIRRELEEPEIRQLELFKPAEREQLERNRAALLARVERIPAEIEEEVARIAARYADLRPRLFPAAVTYLVPEGMD